MISAPAYRPNDRAAAGAVSLLHYLCRASSADGSRDGDFIWCPAAFRAVPSLLGLLLFQFDDVNWHHSRAIGPCGHAKSAGARRVNRPKRFSEPALVDVIKHHGDDCLHPGLPDGNCLLRWICFLPAYAGGRAEPFAGWTAPDCLSNGLVATGVLFSSAQRSLSSAVRVDGCSPRGGFLVMDENIHSFFVELCSTWFFAPLVCVRTSRRCISGRVFRESGCERGSPSSEAALRSRVILHLLMEGRTGRRCVSEFFGCAFFLQVHAAGRGAKPMKLVPCAGRRLGFGDVVAFVRPRTQKREYRMLAARRRVRSFRRCSVSRWDWYWLRATAYARAGAFRIFL